MDTNKRKKSPYDLIITTHAQAVGFSGFEVYIFAVE